MENRMTAGVVVEHGGTRWRIERPLGADAVLLRNDAGEVVSTSPSPLRFPSHPQGQPAGRRVDELQHTDVEWAEAAKRRAVLAGLAGLSSRVRDDVERAARELGIKRRRVFELLRLAQTGCGAVLVPRVVQSAGTNIDNKKVTLLGHEASSNHDEL